MELFSIKIRRTFQLVSTVVKKRTWKFDAEDEEMVCVLKVTFLHHEE